MSKILHVSDTHLGNEQYGEERRRLDFHEAFAEVIDIAIGEHDDNNTPVDAVLHTGDLFDDQRTGLDDLYRCQEELSRLADADVPFYAIVGNHELMRGDTQFVDLYEDAEMAERLDREPTYLGDDVALYGVDYVRGNEWEEADISLKPPEDEEVYTVVGMHQLVHPPIEHEIKADYNAEEVLEKLDMDVDAVALGDYHQRVGTAVNGTRMWYPGSTERCSKSETGRRSVDMLEIDLDSEPRLDRSRIVLDTREFEYMGSIEFGRNDSFEKVRGRVREAEPVEDKVVAVTIEGESNEVTKHDVKNYLAEKGVTHARVDDEREIEIDVEVEIESLDGDGFDIEEEIDEKIEDMDLRDKTREVERSLARDTQNVTKNSIRRRTESMVEEAVDEAVGVDEEGDA